MEGDRTFAMGPGVARRACATTSLAVVVASVADWRRLVLSPTRGARGGARGRCREEKRAGGAKAAPLAVESAAHTIVRCCRLVSRSFLADLRTLASVLFRIMLLILSIGLSHLF